MNLSRRNKRKHIEKAVTMLPAGAGDPLDYRLGGGGSWPPKLLIWAVVGGLVGLSALLSVALGSVTVVGVIPALVVFFALTNPRGVLVTTAGVASLSCSFLNGRPNRLLAWDTWEALTRVVDERSGHTRIAVGRDPVWLKNGELAELRGAVGPAGID